MVGLNQMKHVRATLGKGTNDQRRLAASIAFRMRTNRPQFFTSMCPEFERASGIYGRLYLMDYSGAASKEQSNAG